MPLKLSSRYRDYHFLTQIFGISRGRTNFKICVSPQPILILEQAMDSKRITGREQSTCPVS